VSLCVLRPVTEEAQRIHSVEDIREKLLSRFAFSGRSVLNLKIECVLKRSLLECRL
jgi:hypothetical protein